MSGISTHILDVSRGVAAAGVGVALERADQAGVFTPVSNAHTDADGRAKSLLPAGSPLTVGVYRLRFETGTYFAGLGVRTFFPRIEVVFEITDVARHHHVPLLLSPFGYSTYRGT